MSDTSPELAQLAINTLRFLAVDAVEAAKSGHPGAPLGCAPIAYLLYHKIMKYNPTEPLWSDRDRFVLSNGHASALLYGVLHLTGYDLPISQLAAFRQWGSHTPGHPEYGETPGVEVTTGPLGQGLGMAVGLAIAEKHLAATYNHENHTPVDHYTYVLCGDGDLMEGISHESCSLAGTLNLGKLIVLYDDNLISLDGPTDLSYTEDVTKRFEAYHWHVQMVDDGNDLEAIESAILKAKAETTKPSLIRVRTVIGYGSPKAGTNKVHGEALGPEATKATKKNLGFPEDKNFYVPEEAGKHWLEAVEKGKKAQAEWQEKFEAFSKAYPELGEQYTRTFEGKLAEGWEKAIPVFPTEKGIATRNAGQVILNAVAKIVPELFGGAADLTASTKTIFKDSPSFHVDPKGRNVFFGVREFGMMAAVNGMASHGGLIPFGSTFFTFSDYCRSALRMGALESSHSLYIFTHDSIGLGEDGPTHQPIEHLMSLRAIPQLTDFRPADANETAAVWHLALARKSPSFMALSRQDLPVLDAEKYKVFEGTSKGAYVLENFGTDVILVAAGSEVAMIMKAALELKEAGILATVVSMPSFKIFEEQTEEYKMSIFPHGVPKISLEAGATMGWWKYIGRDGIAIGLDRFGASAPAPLVQDKLGISASAVVEAAKKLVKK
ncbi:transketolase [Granulicella pectinivorans]|uniref:Transketolase n=1 Tax=Granulicella pectinivorans TaxID=474950 RepID=A0A1I6LSL7_9BACT|nr:transketolase [Granulicella pectinivorans]SFS06485.1 transketolase [Granulicella pectinivorans]